MAVTLEVLELLKSSLICIAAQQTCAEVVGEGGGAQTGGGAQRGSGWRGDRADLMTRVTGDEAESAELDSDSRVFSPFISCFHLTEDVIREWNEAAGINLPIPAIRMIDGSLPRRGFIAMASSLSQHFGKVRENESSEVATGGEA